MPSQPTNQPDEPNETEPSRIKRGQRTRELLLSIWEPIDQIGEALMGALWRTVYLTIQDAIALSSLLTIPSLIGKVITGEDYSGFDQCLSQGSIWNVNRYACFIIVTSGFCLWIVLGGRIIIRLFRDLRDLPRNK